MITIDIETECAVVGCIDKSCKHALNPATNRITVVGIDDKVYRSLELVQAAIKGQQLCAFNFKFEHINLNYHGVKVDLEQWVADPFLMAYVSTTKINDQWLAEYEEARIAQPGKHRKAGKHSLKTLAPYFLGVQPFWETENKDDNEYVLKDVRYTAQLHTHLQNIMPIEELCFYNDKLLPWTKMLVEAEVRGVRINTAGLDELDSELLIRSELLLKQLDEQWSAAHDKYYDLQVRAVEERYGKMKINASWGKRQQAARDKCSERVDYDSPKQMLWLLRDCLGYDCTTFEGTESTGREVLERLSDKHPDVRVYLEWRKVNKLLSAFIPTYKELAVNGVINPVYNPGNTRTGRTSSERPNMQQVPPALRKYFVPREGYVFVGYDMGAIEAKLIAYYTGDSALTELIKTGVSLHDYNAKVFFGLDCAVGEVKSQFASERSAAKNVGFALFYNAGFNRIKVAFAQKGFHLSTAQCKAIHARFKKAYPQAIEYAQQVVAHFESGESMPNLLGRPLKIDNPQDCYMQAFNTLIQSSASDLNLDAAHTAMTQMRTAGIEAYPVLFVHDFTAFEVRVDQAERAAQILEAAMTGADLEGIPLTVDGGVMASGWEK